MTPSAPTGTRFLKAWKRSRTTAIAHTAVALSSEPGQKSPPGRAGSINARAFARIPARL